ncbi:hypothetical protein [Psychrobacillus sp. NEAU-3TGS]|uniref:hypothetical protein n=1 Tax=Psychrobacillus sp. NEAU-3TGS TaxID=2995412 RepID=UPI00249B5F9E|nr:hypothetical protein [Psychrobacillus sp. NEAU-3TGS]
MEALVMCLLLKETKKIRTKKYYGCGNRLMKSEFTSLNIDSGNYDARIKVHLSEFNVYLEGEMITSETILKVSCRGTSSFDIFDYNELYLYRSNK